MNTKVHTCEMLNLGVTGITFCRMEKEESAIKAQFSVLRWLSITVRTNGYAFC